MWLKPKLITWATMLSCILSNFLGYWIRIFEPEPILITSGEELDSCEKNLLETLRRVKQRKVEPSYCSLWSKYVLIHANNSSILYLICRKIYLETIYLPMIHLVYRWKLYIFSFTQDIHISLTFGGFHMTRISVISFRPWNFRAIVAIFDKCWILLASNADILWHPRWGANIVWKRDCYLVAREWTQSKPNLWRIWIILYCYAVSN